MCQLSVHLVTSSHFSQKDINMCYVLFGFVVKNKIPTKSQDQIHAMAVHFTQTKTQLQAASLLSNCFNSHYIFSI